MLEAYRGAAPLIGSAVQPSIETVAVLVGTRQKCLLQHWYTNFPELRQTGAVDWCSCRQEAWLAHTQRQTADAAQNQWGSLLDDQGGGGGGQARHKSHVLRGATQQVTV